MKRFIAFACLLASVSCASLPGEDNIRDLNFVKTNIKGVENLLSTLESQINYEVENNPSFRTEESGRPAFWWAPQIQNVLVF